MLANPLKKLIPAIAILGIAVAGVGCSSNPPCATDLSVVDGARESASAAESKLEEAKAQKSRLEKQLAEETSRKGSLESRIAELEAKIAELER